MRGFAQVGIAALVDEATGYQEVRDRKALQAILDAFLVKNLRHGPSDSPTNFTRNFSDYEAGSGEV